MDTLQNSPNASGVPETSVTDEPLHSSTPGQHPSSRKKLIGIIFINVLIVVAITWLLAYTDFLPLIQLPISWPVAVGIYIVPISLIIKSLNGLLFPPQAPASSSAESVTEPSRISWAGIYLLFFGGLGFAWPFYVLFIARDNSWGALMAMILGLPALVLMLVGAFMIVFKRWKQQILSRLRRFPLSLWILIGLTILLIIFML